MSELTRHQVTAVAAAHEWWLQGLYAGRDSVWAGQTLSEAESRSPFLIEGEDPHHARSSEES